MICKYCNSVVGEDSKFCPECGKKIQVETFAAQEEKSIVLSTETEEQHVINLYTDSQDGNEERKIWYYVAEGETLGGYTEAEMLDFVKSGRITKNTYVWREGDADWRFASNSLLGNFFDTPVYEKEQNYEAAEWYYADAGNNQHGPYTESQMIQFIRSGKIQGNNYVWKPGLAEWIFLNQSNLSGYVSNVQSAQVAHQQAYGQRSMNPGQGMYTVSGVPNKSIAIAVILSIVTCGIYTIYWLYTLVRDANKIAASQGQPQVFDAALSILLYFVTCGLFGFYLFWKLGKSFGNCTNKFGNKMEDTSVIMMLLAIFGLSIVSMCIAQSEINECA